MQVPPTDSRPRGQERPQRARWRVVGRTLRPWPPRGPHPGVLQPGKSGVQENRGLMRRRALRLLADRKWPGRLGQLALAAVACAAEAANATDGAALVDGFVVVRGAEFEVHGTSIH